ncbi:PREDICTED: lymphoid-restricted membrane protein [Pterocles gutturalis]|nr:PREDICTED: lymphoid-restricted membrane protein [Pterocles gutturalis]
MSSEHGANKRHHNPVDSICRKIKSIQMMDQVSNPALQIPKFQSRNFDSPQCNIKKNLEEILKKRTFRSHDSSSPHLSSPSSDSLFFADLQLLSPCLRRFSDSHPANATYSIIKSEERSSNSWMPVCPMENCSPSYFRSREANTQNKLCALSNIESKDVLREQKYFTSSPNLYFLTSDKKSESAVIQSPATKRPSLSERGWKQSLGYKADNTYDVSLICEEDLLTTIFCACDIEHTGKVAVSKIVDFLRHTTSRGSEDSGLEELCNMLDPDQKDISVDLETYHAIMKEWIEDCRRKWQDGATEEPTVSTEDLELRAHKNTSEAKKMHVQMNVTSGSLEAFGGDVSKGDMETSDLITCVADLQYNNQKLQEENNKLKLTLEAVDETNNKLMADNEDLRQQIKSIQHSVLKAKSLEEELEEAKNYLNLSEEERQEILCQNKQLNIRNSMDTDGLKKKILELSKNAAELQIQAHIYENTAVNKEASLIQKEQDIKELKLTIAEYSSIIETLRAEKNKLLENMQHMQQELILNRLSFPLLCKFNSNIPEGTNSLRCELELAQSSEITKTEWTSLDETLDREVMFLLQGPEYAGEKFKTIMQNLQEEVSEAEELVMASLQWVEDPDVNMQQAWERKLVVLKQELEEKRRLWIQKLKLLEKYKDFIDKDFIQMAGNLRRTKTEQFHLRKELSARQREIETVKQLQEETAGQAEALSLELQKATKQLEDASKQAEDQVEAFHSACEEATSLKCKLEEAISEQQKLKDANAALTRICQLLQEKVEDQKSCLVMEEKPPKGSHKKEEDVLTSVAMEKNNDKDPAGPVAGAELAKMEFCPVMEEHKTAFQNLLKQELEVDQEKKNNKEQREEAPAVVPSRKGSSPTAGGIKGDKTKQKEPDSPNEKEVEAEFLRLSLGFKCDLFTLDKRVKLEERSRDLAEENLKKEITNALKMLEALVPLCEEDNQAQEVVKKLQKSLQFLSQYAARVASRAEMLGAINQESRVSKAVEVMIQHVENLKRMYAKEHAELEELKQVLLQNERTFSTLGDQDESTNKKLPNSFNFKPSSSLRRVSIATVPRSTGNAGIGLPLAQLHEPDGDERSDKFTRRSSSWGRLGAKQHEKRPSLQRFISTYSWAEYEDEHSETKNEQLETPAEVQEQPSRKESISEKGKYSSRWNLESVYNFVSSWASHFKTSFSNTNKTLWVSVSVLVLLAALTSFLTGLSLQRPADAAPVGTGDSWTSLQQLLWPYTGLQHNGPPPV